MKTHTVEKSQLPLSIEPAVSADDPVFTDAINAVDFASKYKINKNIIFEIKVYNVTNSKSSVANRPAGLRPNMPRQLITSISFDF